MKCVHRSIDPLAYIAFAEVSGFVVVSMIIFTLTTFSSLLVLSEDISVVYPAVVVSGNVVVVGKILIYFSI